MYREDREDRGGFRPRRDSEFGGRSNFVPVNVIAKYIVSLFGALARNRQTDITKPDNCYCFHPSGDTWIV